MQSSGGRHRRLCPPANYLDTSKVFEARTTAQIKKKVVVAAGGAAGAQRPVRHSILMAKRAVKDPLLAATRRLANTLWHLVLNVSWLISLFCHVHS